MPSNTAKSTLTLPATVQGHPTLVAAVNDSFRKVQQMLDSSNAKVPSAQSVTNVTTTTGSGSNQLILSVPGTLGADGNVAPLVLLPFSITPVAIVPLVKEASVGGKIQIQLNVAGVSYYAMSLGAGLKMATLSGSFALIPANSLVTMDIVSVPTAFPGAGLSVLIQW